MSMATRLSGSSGKDSPMDKPEAERLYDSGKDPTVGKLLELDEENKTLKQEFRVQPLSCPFYPVKPMP